MLFWAHFLLELRSGVNKAKPSTPLRSDHENLTMQYTEVLSAVKMKISLEKKILLIILLKILIVGTLLRGGSKE